MNIRTRFVLIVFYLFCTLSSSAYDVHAQGSQGAPEQLRQTSPATSTLLMPIIPFIAEYDYASLYFMQWTNDDPHYSRITAAVAEGEAPVYTVTLAERNSKKQIFYSNSEAHVASLKREGKDAYKTPIDYRVTRNVGQPATYGFGFRDIHGRAILWRFTPASNPSERGAGLIPLSSVPGLRLEYSDLGTTAGAGTATQIADRVSEAEPWTEISAPPYFVAYRGSHAEGRHMGALLTGVESWRVVSSPKVTSASELREGASWVLREAGGRERTLRVAARRADETIITQKTADAPNLSGLELRARIAPDGFALREVRFMRGSRHLRISFTPELALFDSASNTKRTTADFEIDMGNHKRVAHGVVTIEKQSGVWTLRWTPRAPDWAKSRPLVSTIKTGTDGYTVEVTQPPTALGDR